MRYTPDAGNVYIDVRAKVKNLMERDISIGETFDTVGIYDGKYKYNGFSIVDTGSSFDWVSSYSAATPLQTVTMHSLIECPDEVYTSGKSVSVVIAMGDGSSCQYTLR